MPAGRVGRPIPTGPLRSTQDFHPGGDVANIRARHVPPGPLPPDMPPLPPPDCSPDDSRLAAHVEAANGAVSANTERAIRADLAVFRAWRHVHAAAAVPASPETIAAFVDDMAETRAPATVRRYLATLAVAHRAAGHADSLRHPLVKLAVQRMHRRRGRRQKQALALDWRLRKRLLAAAGERLIDDRNRALVAVAYDTMLRRSELTAARLADLAPHVHGGATLLVRRGKTDGDGRSATVYIARDSAELLADWLRRASLAGGRLFRSVSKGGAVAEGLHPSQVPRIFKAMARTAGLPLDIVDGLSGHSTRVGAAQDMIAAGIEMPAILQAGRWKTAAMVSRYGERLLAGRSGAAQLARLQRRE